MQQVDHSKNIIEVKDLSFSYGSGEVLSDISLTIHKGDYLGIVGPNGAGKTTLLKAILGLITPTKGSVKLFGYDIKDFREWSRIGYVPQKVTNFDSNFPATVREVVLMGRYAQRGMIHRLKEEDSEAAKAALINVGMWDYKDRLIGDLSGGQQQRVFIARALAGNPEVIFLDEPTTGVDRETQNELYALLRKLNREFDLTLVLISHDVDMMTKEAMHIAYIERRLVSFTSPDELAKERGSGRFNKFL